MAPTVDRLPELSPPRASRARRTARPKDRRAEGARPLSAAAARASGPGRLGSWTLLGVRDLEVAPGEFLDVDVLERHNLDVLNEAGGPVHVPHPSVLHGDLEKDLTVVGRADVQLDLVGEVEPALGLDHVGEQAHYVPILAIEL